MFSTRFSIALISRIVYLLWLIYCVVTLAVLATYAGLRKIYNVIALSLSFGSSGYKLEMPLITSNVLSLFRIILSFLGR